MTRKHTETTDLMRDSRRPAALWKEAVPGVKKRDEGENSSKDGGTLETPRECLNRCEGFSPTNQDACGQPSPSRGSMIEGCERWWPLGRMKSNCGVNQETPSSGGCR